MTRFIFIRTYDLIPVSILSFPRSSATFKSWLISLSPGNNILPSNISANTHAELHISNLLTISLPGGHYLRRAVEPRGNITCHLGLPDPGESKVAYLKIVVLVYEDIAGF